MIELIKVSIAWLQTTSSSREVIVMESPSRKIIKIRYITKICYRENSSLSRRLVRWPQQFCMSQIAMNTWHSKRAGVSETNPNLSGCFHNESTAAYSKDVIWPVLPVWLWNCMIMSALWTLIFLQWTVTITRECIPGTKNIIAHLYQLKYPLLHT